MTIYYAYFKHDHQTKHENLVTNKISISEHAVGCGELIFK